MSAELPVGLAQRFFRSRKSRGRYQHQKRKKKREAGNTVHVVLPIVALNTKLQVITME